MRIEIVSRLRDSASATSRNLRFNSLRASEQNSAKKIYIHPEFDNVTLHNDIAVIVLSEKLKVGPKINPVCLPPPSTEADVSCCGEMKVGKGRIDLRRNLNVQCMNSSILERPKHNLKLI